MTEPAQRLAAALAGHYTVERELGAGGMATVYLGHDLKHDRQVAIKVLRPELSASLGSERFLQEIRLAARLQHPHIVGLLDSGVIGAEAGQGTLSYYVMPFIEGETLRGRLARTGPLPVPEVVRLIGEIADALAKAHKAGIVHRDIKPDNILLADGHALVMDFGVAKAVSEATGRHDVTTAGVALGTPAYMAPEQVAADPKIDHRADLYALGIVAYEMLAGASPYSATTPAQQMAAHITQPAIAIVQRRHECPPALGALIMRCLAKNPDERWQSAEEIVVALRSVGSMAAPRTPWPTALRLAAAGGAVVLLIGGILGIRRFAGGSDAMIATGDRTVGVMLFDNITHDTADAYLSDGLASEIATSLARVPRLEVRSPGAVRSAERGSDDDPREVGRRLRVRNVVEGEFQRGGDRIRIAARLVAVPSGTQRWSESWTRPVTDLLSVQEEIARAVATAIAGALLPREQKVLAARPTADPQAYDHFLRGNFELARRTPSGMRSAITEYATATRLDSSFVRAEARIALAYALFVEWGWDYPAVPRDSLIARGVRAADRALTLDSTVADGWMARGLLLYDSHPRTLEGALPALLHATELDSNNAEAWHQYASTLLVAGEFEKSIAPLRRSLALEPGRAITWANLGDAFWALGRDREALVAFDSTVAANPDFHIGYFSRVWVRLRLGDRVGARADAEAALRVSPPGEQYYGLAAGAAVAAADGDTAQARRLMARAVAPFSARPLRGLPAQAIVLGLVASGQRDLALAWLERATPRGAEVWWGMQVPEAAALRDDPRFKRVMEESRPPDAP